MGIVDIIREAAQKHEERRLSQLDAEIAGLMFTPDASDLPRVIRTPHIEQKGEGYMVPGKMFSDGKARLFVSEHTTVTEAAIEWPDA